MIYRTFQKQYPFYMKIQSSADEQRLVKSLSSDHTIMKSIRYIITISNFEQYPATYTCRHASTHIYAHTHMHTHTLAI